MIAFDIDYILLCLDLNDVNQNRNYYSKYIFHYCFHEYLRSKEIVSNLSSMLIFLCLYKNENISVKPSNNNIAVDGIAHKENFLVVFTTIIYCTYSSLSMYINHGRTVDNFSI